MPRQKASSEASKRAAAGSEDEQRRTSQRTVRATPRAEQSRTAGNSVSALRAAQVRQTARLTEAELVGGRAVQAQMERVLVDVLQIRRPTS